jgi:hypothetical protein
MQIRELIGGNYFAGGNKRSVAALLPFPYTRTMNTTTKTPKRLTRKQINEGLDTVPVSVLLSGSSRELTGKQKAFARAVALGSTGADAYRKVYSDKPKPKIIGNAASVLKQHPGISQEIEAIKRAVEAEHIKSPAALRALVINTLVEVATNPDSKDSVRLQAVKILGTVTEIAAFTERKETKVITSSADARAEIMAELRALSNADAIDVETEAESLLGELKAAAIDTHPSPTPQTVDDVALVPMHTIPLKPDPINSDATPLTPPSSNSEDPPSSFSAK